MHTNFRDVKSMTLLELLIAIVLLTVVVMGIFGVSFFAGNQVTNSERSAKVQNEAAIVLAHMTRNIAETIGNRIIIPDPIDTGKIQGDDGIKFRVSESPERWSGYRFTGATGALADRYRIFYYATCVNPNCNGAGSSNPELVGTNVVQFDITPMPNDNFVEVFIAARYNPSQVKSSANPEVTLTTRIKMPAVSTN